jgi:2-isopropylmalate synthase
VRAGARQVECAINGIGERAGNASLEEIVMLLHTRAADIGLRTAVNTREIARTSRLVSRLTGYVVQPNKAVVGRNAFAHESGIHQDGVLKERTTFEIMDARSVGFATNSLVLGKHSGRHALRQALENLGIEVQGQALNMAFKRFKEIADRKKTVSAMDLEALVTDELREEIAGFTLESYELDAGTGREPRAQVVVRTPAGEVSRGASGGDGSVDSVFAAINVATGIDARLREFRIDAVTEGKDALGEVSVVVSADDLTASGQGVSTDIIEAAARAYLRALTALQRREQGEPAALFAAPEIAPTP